MSYLVLVTYGTTPNMTFADVPELKSAEALLKLAKEKGYSNARIEEKDAYRRSFRAKSPRREA